MVFFIWSRASKVKRKLRVFKLHKFIFDKTVVRIILLFMICIIVS